jgi:glycerol kinase
MFGLTRNSGRAEFARAALESVGFQTRDLLEAMRSDWQGAAESVLRVDGGMASSAWAMQFLADIIGAPVDRPVFSETTALGAAYLAGLQRGLCPEPEDFAKSWALSRRFVPVMARGEADAKYARWRRAVEATMQF